MTVRNRIKAFEALGEFLAMFTPQNSNRVTNLPCVETLYNKFAFQIQQSVHYNGWFTEENVLFAIQTWAKTLSKDNINKWVSLYHFPEKPTKSIGIVTAGNIPLVGFHDFITALVSGHQLQIKQSSGDQKLLPVLAEFLLCVNKDFEDLIHFTDKPFNDIDAVIATGSNNTARYFEYYFKKYPHIIRKNRNAVAILTGKESKEALSKLGEDIFRYYGLGCRSVSKIFVPENYNFNLLFKAIQNQQNHIDYQKYKNNYDYNKTVYLMSQIPILDNGFLVLKEDAEYASPIATLFYESYDTLNTVYKKLHFDKDKIQCVIGTNDLDIETIPFGESQSPELWEYADGVDTMKFLLNL